ncbi:MAG TPA: antibiotic biosynthesis monooxygenase family protein [Candidatus Baltobacteraceae bacterium]|nr:antibiotic biosynthesis monooxygenase family protein [Candidatus Baltobacteraceae bacterium]
MRSLRVLYCSNERDLPDRMCDLRRRAAEMRTEPGCIELDYFRDVEFPENFAQLELWESPAAFDRHWAHWGTDGLFSGLPALSAPNHGGTPEYPRRHGINAAEFYHHQRFQLIEGAFVPFEPADRIASVRWRSRPGHRIVIQSSSDPHGDVAFLPYSYETRSHTGCVEFAYYRSLAFPENVLHLELWAGPPAIYDEHYFQRTLARLHGDRLAQPAALPLERRYGVSGSEHYEHAVFTLVDKIWQPEDPHDRIATVRWP